MKKTIELYVARDEDGHLWGYDQKPHKEGCSWYPRREGEDYLLNINWFPEVKWTDEKPKKVTITLEED